MQHATNVGRNGGGRADRSGSAVDNRPIPLVIMKFSDAPVGVSPVCRAGNFMITKSA
jgi:hypothetical protein